MTRLRNILSYIFVLFNSLLITTFSFAQEKEIKEFIQEAVKNSPPQSLTEVAADQIDTARNLINLIIEFCVNYSFQVIGGLIVLFVGWLVAKYVAGLLEKLMKKKNVDVTVTKFASGAVYLGILGFACMVSLGKFGIEIAPLIAGISVAGLGVGIALQGPLSNYAAGIALIFTKPFKVGDIIEVAGVNGEVIDMKLPRTDIKTVDGNLIFIPNKHIIGEVMP